MALRCPAVPDNGGGNRKAEMATAHQSTPSLRAQAEALAARGFKVFPLIPNGKTPRDKAFYDVATADPQGVHDLWTDSVTGWPQPWNIGLLMGDGFAAIDVDVKNGKPGMASLGALNLPRDTLTVRTPSGGLHLLYATDRDVANVSDSDKSPSPLGGGIDVRGHHGYLVGAGSVIDEQAYAIEHDAPLVALPLAILDRLAAPRTRAEPCAAPATDLDAEFAVARAAKYLANEAPIAIEGAGGDDTTFRVLCIAKDMGVSADTLFDLAADHWNDRCNPPWGLGELRQKVDNAFAYALSSAGGQSPAVDLAGVVDMPPPRYIVAPAGTPAALKWADDADSDKPIEWLLKGILPRQGVGIVYGAPKSGKSFVAFDLAARLACMLPWFNVRTPKERIGTLLLLGEGAGTIRTRLAAFRQATGAAMPSIAWASVANLSSAAGIIEARRIIADAKAGMAARGIRLGLIEVDTLASALGLEDENSAPEVTAALKALEALAVEFDVAVLGIHHAGKNGQDRGSSAFRAACDVMLSVDRGDVTPGQPDNHRQLSVVLNRNGEGDWSTNFRLDRVVLGIDEDGDEITSCAVRPAGEPVANISQREIIMGLFDPATIHLNGFRLPDDEWGITRKDLRTRCAAVWDDMSADAVKKRVQRSVVELIQAGRLKELAVSGAMYLVAVEQRIGGGDASASLF